MMSEQLGSGFIKEDRRCTDVFFLLLLLVYCIATLAVTQVVWKRGNPERLTHGMDSEGNLCGLPGPNIPSPLILEEQAIAEFGDIWKDRRFIWFPAPPKGKTQKPIDIQDALKLGVCVDHCPNISDVVSTYTEKSHNWHVTYNSAPVLGRCIPQLSDTTKVKELGDLRASLQATAWLLWFVQNAWAFRWAMGAVTLTAVGLCFLWTVFMTVAIKPVISVTLALVAMMIGGAAYLTWTQGVTYGLTAEHTLWSKVGTGALVALLAAYFVLLGVLGKRIFIAADIIKMSSQVMMQVPALLCVPLVVFLGWIVLSAWWMYTVVLLHTSGSMKSADIDLVHERIHVIFAQPDKAMAQMSWFMLLGYLWLTAFLSAVTFMVIAFTAVFWYFSFPGDQKLVQPGAIWRSLIITGKYHLGTVAFGSLFLGIIQTFRLFLHFVEEQCRKLRQNENDLGRFIFRCADCCLACLERTVKYISHNAYIVTCIEGTGFCASVGTSMRLVVSNVARVGTTTFVVDAVIFLIKFFITGSNILLCYALMEKTSYFQVPDGAKAPSLILVGLITYITASFFMAVFHTVIDTILMCVLVDESVNNGTDRPYYMTSEMQELTRKHNITDSKEGAEYMAISA